MKYNAALPRLRALSALVSATTLLAACGGGGGSDSPAPPSGTTVSGKALDGALQGAIACYDLNDNRACDAGEPVSAATTADGSYSISDIEPAQLGLHGVVIDVPATAIDADTGAAVGTAFTLLAPATGTGGSQTVIVSPLSTLVQRHMDVAAVSRDEAVAYVQAQSALAVSPLADYSASSSGDNLRAANVAKVVLLTALQQSAAAASAVGQTDVSGATITAADIARASLDTALGALPSIGATAADPAVTALTGTAREQALAAAASQVVTDDGFTAEQARLIVGAPKVAQPAAETPQAGANMAQLQFTDASNWFVRYNASTAADNTPDANGMVRYYTVRTRNTAGTQTSFVRNENPELHWSGSAWTACEISDRSNSTVRDSLGRSSYDFCRNHEKGISERASFDIAGETLASVWSNRILVEQARTTNPTGFSLPDVALLGSAVFPEGSTLQLGINRITETAITYNTVDTNRLNVPSLAAGQGGDARTTSGLACSGTVITVLATSLEQMVERALGRPCIFGQQTDDPSGPSLDPNEIWSNTSVSLGNLAFDVARPANTANHYTTTRLLRASFPSAGNAVYWSCLQRTTTLGSRNCTQIGTGTYTIAPLGDARVMTFAGLPAAAQANNSTRVFVERGGAIYFGFKPRVGAQTTSVRLNLPAANAVLTQLGMPTITPIAAP